MKLIKGRINWWHGYGNLPTLELMVDNIPAREEMLFERRGDCFFSEKHGYVEYYYWQESLGQQEGFGGYHFNIHLKDGGYMVLKGPWASRSQVMNQVGFPTSVDVVLKSEDGKSYGHAVTLDWLRSWVNLIDPKFIPAKQITGDLFVPQLVNTRLVYNPITYVVDILGEDATGKLYQKVNDSNILFEPYRPVVFGRDNFPHDSMEQVDVT